MQYNQDNYITAQYFFADGCAVSLAASGVNKCVLETSLLKRVK